MALNKTEVGQLLSMLTKGGGESADPNPAASNDDVVTLNILGQEITGPRAEVEQKLAVAFQTAAQNGQQAQQQPQQGTNSKLDLEEYKRRFMQNPVEAQGWANKQVYGYDPNEVLPVLAQQVQAVQQQLGRSSVQQQHRDFKDSQKNWQQLEGLVQQGRARDYSDAYYLAKSQGLLELEQEQQQAPTLRFPSNDNSRTPEGPQAPPILTSSAPGHDPQFAELDQRLGEVSTEELRGLIGQLEAQTPR